MLAYERSTTRNIFSSRSTSATERLCAARGRRSAGLLTKGRASARRQPRARRGAGAEAQAMKVAMLAPISWRTPPRALRPVGAGHQPVDRGFGRARRRRHPVRDAGQRHRRQARRHRPRALIRKTPRSSRRSGNIAHLAHLFEQADKFDLIHNQADFPAHAFANLVATPIVTTIHGFSSPTHPADVRALSGPRTLMSRSATRTGIRPCAMPRPSITASGSTNSRSMRPGSDDLLFFGRIHPDKGAKRGDRRRARERPPARSCTA